MGRKLPMITAKLRKWRKDLQGTKFTGLIYDDARKMFQDGAYVTILANYHIEYSTHYLVRSVTNEYFELDKHEEET